MIPRTNYPNPKDPAFGVGCMILTAFLIFFAAAWLLGF